MHRTRQPPLRHNTVIVRRPPAPLSAIKSRRPARPRHTAQPAALRAARGSSPHPYRRWPRQAAASYDRSAPRPTASFRQHAAPPLTPRGRWRAILPGPCLPLREAHRLRYSLRPCAEVPNVETLLSFLCASSPIFGLAALLRLSWHRLYRSLFFGSMAYFWPHKAAFRRHLATQKRTAALYKRPCARKSVIFPSKIAPPCSIPAASRRRPAACSAPVRPGGDAPGYPADKGSNSTVRINAFFSIGWK